MKKILSIIKLIRTNNLNFIFSNVGTLKKQIGNQYFLTPTDDFFNSISLLFINGLIKKIGIQLSTEIDLKEVEHFLLKKASVSYSKYDGITYYTFLLENGCKISFIKRDTLYDSLAFKDLEIGLIKHIKTPTPTRPRLSDSVNEDGEGNKDKK